MIAVTELGDAQVLLSVILAALAWFLGHRLSVTAGTGSQPSALPRCWPRC